MNRLLHWSGPLVLGVLLLPTLGLWGIGPLQAAPASPQPTRAVLVVMVTVEIPVVVTATAEPTTPPTWMPLPTSEPTVAPTVATARRFTRDDVDAALVMASPRVRCVISYEAPSHDPYSVGDHGHSHGIAQLSDLPTGLLADYTRWSHGASPYDPFSAVAYMNDAERRGLLGRWSPVYWLGAC